MTAQTVSTTDNERNDGVRKPTNKQGIRCLSRMGGANTAQMVAPLVTLGNCQSKSLLNIGMQ